MTRGRRAGNVAWILLCWASAVPAQEAPREESAPTRAPEAEESPPLEPSSRASDEPAFSIHGTYFIHGSYTTDFPLTEDAAVLRGRTWPDGVHDGLDVLLDHRLRISAAGRLSSRLRVVGMADLAGFLGGDTTDIGRDYLLVPRDRARFYDRSTVRELYLEWTTAAGVLRIGQMASHFGLGLVANSGADPDGAFHDPYLGDLVLRGLFATRPLELFSNSHVARHLYLAIGGDLVYRDEHASLLKGDLAVEGVASVFYDGPAVRGGDDLFAGVYVAYRQQRWDNHDRLWALVLDAAFRHQITLDRRGTWLGLQAEGALMLGRIQFEDRGGPPRAPDGADLREWGGVLRAELDVPDAGLRPGLEAGVASGDADPTDAVARAFQFDPSYQVGMILFQEVLDRISALAPERVSDPHLLFKAPSGYKLGATNGSITNTVYLYPKIRYWPLPPLELHVAFLWARALAPVAGPYNTAGNGGYPLGYRVDPRQWVGRWTEKDLGMEVDGAVSYTFGLRGSEQVRLGLQGGWCRPGAAFRDAAGRRLPSVYKARVLVDISW